MVIQNPIPQSGNSVFENIYVYGDCKFDKDVTINGQLKYDELSLVRLTVTDKITAGIVTATTYYGNVSSSGIITATGYSTVGGGSTQYLMADGSVSTRYIGVGVGSTPGSNGGNAIGNDGDIWYTLC